MADEYATKIINGQSFIVQMTDTGLTHPVTGGKVVAEKVNVSGSTTPAGPVRGSITNRSLTLAVGGTAQDIMAANATRNYIFLQNPLAATESLWFDVGADAVVAGDNSIELVPGQSWEMVGFVPTQRISVVAATTNHKIKAKEG